MEALYNAHIYQQGTQGTLVYTFILDPRGLPFYATVKN